jgi:hypothetical protein
LQVEHLLAFEAHPVKQTLHETVLLPHLFQRVHRAPAQQTEVACLGRDIDIAQGMKKPIKQMCRRSLYKAFAIPRRSSGIDIV